MIRLCAKLRHLAMGLWLLCILLGCGYTLQGKASLPYDRIALGLIENATFEPKLQDRLSKAIVRTLLEYSIEVDPAATHRIDGKISRFELRVLSEKNLVASQYEAVIVGSFFVTDTRNGSTISLGEISSPFAHYFSATGPMETVLSNKETAVNRALQDLSQEIARRMIYAPAR